MSHLPIKEVDYYLDKLNNRWVLFVGGAVIVLLVFGTTFSNMLNAATPQGATKAGQTSDHYPDGIVRTATVGGDNSRASALYYSSPYVLPPYQDDRMTSDYGGYV